MKSHLVHILPVWRACEILGEPVVRRMVGALLRLRQHHAVQARLTDAEEAATAGGDAAYDLEQDQDVLTQALLYRHPPKHNRSQPLPTVIAHAWKRWLSARHLALDKNTLIHFVVPQTVQPHSGPAGHMGLFDCWVYALQGHGTNSATSTAQQSYYGSNNAANNHHSLVWLPDVLILLAAAQNYTNHINRPLPQQDQAATEEPSAAAETDVKEEKDAATTAEGDESNKKDNDHEPNPQEDDKPSDAAEEEEEMMGDRRPPSSSQTRKSSFAHRKTASGELDDIHQSITQQKGSVPTQSQSEDDEKDDAELLEEAVRIMAVLAFRIYDSYQKKGSVTRDTLHRFLTDVHGEDSFKEATPKALLDALFDSKDDATTNLQASISESQFVLRVTQAATGVAEPAALAAPAADGEEGEEDAGESPRSGSALSPPPQRRRTPGHWLLDWMATWLGAMIPPAELSGSVAAYLDTMQHRPKPLCLVYELAEARLFEVKRRFHSLVQAGPAVIQGDPMSSGDTETGSGGSHASSSSSASVLQNQQPKHVIQKSAFVDAVCQANHEMGHGGYVPAALAELLFCAGARNMYGESSVSSSGVMPAPATASPSGSDEEPYYWGLANLLQFGCMAVRRHVSHREQPELPLMRFLFAVFGLNTDPHAAVYNDASSSNSNNTAGRVLTRAQVERMLLLLVEHAQFRHRADTPPLELLDLEEEEEKQRKLQPPKDDDETTVDWEAAWVLGLLPPRDDPKQQKRVPLSQLVDYALKDCSSEDGMSFDEFCAWDQASTLHAPNENEDEDEEDEQDEDTSTSSRLSLLILDLRLMASVLFGVPPTTASMEIALIAELERRHKARYKQTSVSRRGPRGTIWYIIDAAWLRHWAQRVKDCAAAGGTEDEADGRNEATGRVRGLVRIDNANLMAASTLALRQDIQWKHDYEILPPLAWHALQAWYDGGPPIYRSVVRYVDTTSSTSNSSSARTANNHARMPTENEIELYPYFVTVYLCDAASQGEARPFQQHYQLSRVSPVGVMLVQLCKELDVDPAQARLWVLGATPAVDAVPNDTTAAFDEGFGQDWILNTDQNIVDQRKARLDPMQLKRDILLLLELKTPPSKTVPTASWPRGEDGKEWLRLATARHQLKSGGSSSSSVLAASAAAAPQPPQLGDGIVGLYNMGNTCFLNSSIQCISHTPIFREYFTSKAYLNDINTTNPLGHSGQLAQVSAVLINSLWKPFPNQTTASSAAGAANNYNTRRVTAPNSYVMVQCPSLTPKTFKESLGKFNELFAGNEQHDAQELLTFLLAGLSEDLNRILDKPYMEAPDSDGRPDAELADIWWSNHLRRELSIVVALFNGQYKNLLTCRTCKYKSARFEPFSALTVPLPEDDSLTVSIVLYPFALPHEPMRYCVRVLSTGTLGDVLRALAKELVQDTDNKQQQKESGEAASSAEAGEEGADDKKARIEGGAGGGNTTDDDEEEPREDPRVVQKAKDLTIVDLRDGYIFRIAPLTWKLVELQNKDTGDLPTMYAYELDDSSSSESSETAQVTNSTPQASPAAAGEQQKEGPDAAVEDEKPAQPPSPSPRRRSGYLAISQRRSELISRDYLHPLSHRLFGTPVLLRLTDMETCTGHQLYDWVAQRLRPLVHKAALRFLMASSSPPAAASTEEKPSNNADSTSTEAVPSEEDGGDRIGSGGTNSTVSLTDSEDVSAGPVPRYGFRLRITSRDGRKCLICPWYKCCVGCLIRDDESLANVMDGDSLVVDWHFAVDVATLGFGTRAGLLDPIAAGGANTRQQTLPQQQQRPIGALPVKTHRSCGIGAGKSSGLAAAGAITLEHCLQAFAKEERIPEAYCSKCKEFRVQTTRMTLWRLPPILIIHLKRFQFTPTMRRKLRDLVIFPLEGLDLSAIMAPNGEQSEGIGRMPPHCTNVPKPETDDTTASSSTSEAPASISGSPINRARSVFRTMRGSPDGKNDDDDEKDEKKNKDESTASSTNSKNDNMLYDLYGVIHHQGALSGGHYVASLKSELDGQWRLFNDAQIYEIHARDVIDASAYILFYMRRDVALNKVRLEDFWDLKQVATMSEEEMHNLVRQGKWGDRCSIS